MSNSWSIRLSSAGLGGTPKTTSFARERRNFIDGYIVNQNSKAIHINDNSIRLCVGYRELNTKTVEYAFALLRLNETFDAPAGAKYFSCLGPIYGYWQIEVAEEDKV